MQTSLKVHARVQVNNERFEETFELGEIRNQIAKFAKWLIDLDLDSRDFSTLTLILSKRPIIMGLDSKWDQLLADNHTLVNQVTDEDCLEGFPDIIWGEFSKVADDPIFTAALNLKQSKNRTQFTGDEIDRIKVNFHQKYGDTKYFKLIGDL